ncbi:hypothetical protein ACFX5K_01750 [Rickettsiales bacterium LUAb2]
MKKLLVLLCLIVICLFKVSYVNAIINNSTNQYYEIDFTYTNVVNNKTYTEKATLLRDKAWLAENNIHKAGDTLILNIPEFGVINAKATAKEVKSTNLNPIKAYTNNQSMVTGKFKHYSTDVREYILKDIKSGSIQTIQATPNHAFYVQNRTAFNKALNEQSHFIEIQNITPNDKLINEAGNVVQLVCDNNICGKQLVTNNKPIAVYNLEIFKQHQYLVLSNNAIKQGSNNIYKSNIAFKNAVLVHNVYGCLKCFNSYGTSSSSELEAARGTLFDDGITQPRSFNINDNDAANSVKNRIYQVEQDYKTNNPRGFELRSKLVHRYTPESKTVYTYLPNGNLENKAITARTKFNNDSWMLKNAVIDRNIGNINELHYTDILREQFIVQAEESGNWMLPSQAVQYNIVNSPTIRGMSSIADNFSTDIKLNMLQKLPNGKAIPYILNDFNLQITDLSFGKNDILDTFEICIKLSPAC